MIDWKENNIGYLTADDFVKNRKACLDSLKERKNSDLILDCSTFLPMPKELEEVRVHQQKLGLCFVLVLSPDHMHSFPPSWVIVPTKKEALDFISFEQMQRNLGF
ncbi:MAG: hypothetical protein P8I42_00325 [Flavobacteriaceae bacterium]|nr:hypothetical protein [Flavobacteriaceae bacterium]